MKVEVTRHRILQVGAELLARQPYETVDLSQIASELDCPTDAVIAEFPTLHALGSEILNLEGNSMRQAMSEADEMSLDALERLCVTFRLVGRNLGTNLIVRAGIRLAAESAHKFPERKINPFRTWEHFVSTTLNEAAEHGLIRSDIQIGEATWLLVAVGMGTKDLLQFTGSWADAEDKLESAARATVRMILTPTEVSNNHADS